MDIPAKVTSKGQITLPKPVRDALGLKAGDRVLFRIHPRRAVLAKVPDFLSMAGSVPVPAPLRGVPWGEIRLRARRERASRR